MRAAHASKVRKIIHVKKGNMIQQAETEYSSGSLWLSNKMVCSGVRPKPKEQGHAFVEGKFPGAWVDATALGQLLGVPADEIAELWRSYMEE